MINHRFIPTIHIHPILFIFIFISILTGTFIDLFIIISIVFIHELGHFFAASYYKWRIKRIMLWVFGGVMDTDEHGNRPIKEEFIVTISGPFQHLIIYFIMYFVSIFSLLPPSLISTILFYNTTILIFNLLPVWPLDGGKLLFYLLSKRFSFQKAYYTTIQASIVIISFIIIAQLVFFPFTLSACLLMIFLLVENYSDWKKRHFTFIRFLLNRYKGNHLIRSVSSITVPSQYSLMDVFSHFRRDVKHSIYIQMPNNKRVTIDESDCLKSYFFDKHYHKTIGEIATYSTI